MEHQSEIREVTDQNKEFLRAQFMSEFEHIKQEGTNDVRRNEVLIEEQYKQDLQVSKFTDFKDIQAD
jgi:hypothetical protein